MGKGTAPIGLRALADLATPMAVRVAATLRIADHITAGHRTAEEIASAAGAHADSLDSLLRHLVAVGLFTRDGRGFYGVTESGEQLRDDHAAGKRKWLDMNGAVGRGDLAFVELAHSVLTGQPAYPVRYGTPFWKDLACDPVLSASFDALMSHHLELDYSGIAAAYDWAGLRHVVDVGGGSGGLLHALLTVHENLSGTVLDLRGPASAAHRRFLDAGLSERARVTVGSFFDPLPAGAGGYVLSAVLHDWDDRSAVAILRRCAEAAGIGGVVLVVEAVASDKHDGTGMGLRMLTYFGGKERGLAELGELAAQAGLAVRATHPIGYVSIVEMTAA